MTLTEMLSSANVTVIEDRGCSEVTGEPNDLRAAEKILLSRGFINDNKTYKIPRPRKLTGILVCCGGFAGLAGNGYLMIGPNSKDAVTEAVKREGLI